MIAITGGGTGGHLRVVDAIKIEFNSRGIKPIFVGSNSGQDRDWFEEDDGFSEKFFFNTSGVVNQNIFGKLKAMVKILSATMQCITIFKRYRVKKVFSVGGYSASAASFAAVLLGVDFYIHEQNATIGRLNRVLKQFSREFFSSYFESSKIRDYPLDNIFFDRARVRDRVDTILFLGGSQGAKAINDFAILIALDLKRRGIKIIHQTGKKDYLRVKREYERLGVEVELFDFSRDLIDKIVEADFAISRSGASTLWELVANQLPTLFVPYPHAAKDHQFFNAKCLGDRNLAFLKRESQLSKRYILEILDENLIHRVSDSLKNKIERDGAKKIVDEVLRD